MLPMLLSPTGMSAETGSGASTAIASPASAATSGQHQVEDRRRQSCSGLTSHACVGVAPEQFAVADVGDRPERVLVAVHAAGVVHELRWECRCVSVALTPWRASDARRTRISKRL